MQGKGQQVIMVWFLPIIVIGGFFFPFLGYLVVAMMAFFLTLSLFRGRYWCWYLCPRGAFLDIVASRISPNKSFPGFFPRIWFRLIVLVILMSFLVFRLLQTGGRWLAIGAVFVSVCIITTLIALVLALLAKHRGWCVICPMGLLQEFLGKIGKRFDKKKP